jgi:Helix-turn-helix domain
MAMTDDNTAGRNNHARAIIDQITANVPAVEGELLTVTEVADILRAPVATLRYWRHLGTGPHNFRIGRGVRYWHHDVTTWLIQQSSATEKSRPRTGR